MSIASELRLTNADLEAMPEDGNRYEVIDGELYVSSAPGYIHQTILVNIGDGVRRRTWASIRSGRYSRASESSSTITTA